MPTYHIDTYGCQMNVLDSELAEGQLRKLGFEPAESRKAADLILINTCSVREHAEHKVWSRLGEVAIQKRNNPDLIVGMLGCMAQEWQDKVRRKAPVVDIVLGPRQIGEVGEVIEQLLADRAPIVRADLTQALNPQRDIAVRGAPYSAFVTVMYGCDFNCTYCIVPSTRGKELSRPVAEIQAEVAKLCTDGVKEVTLLGQTIDSWGKSLPGRPNLGDLLEAIHETPGLERIRFVTSHPQLMREPILRRVAQLPKVCEYLHIPVQSGSNRMLKAMRRGYTVERYKDIVASARTIVGPDVAIASDFIVGFPGETDDDFAATAELVAELDFAQAYVFKYSPRPGTPSKGMEDDVPETVKRDRNQKLLAIQERVQRRRHTALIGTMQQVLCEGASKSNASKLAGRNRHNRLVVFEGDASALTGQVVDLQITDATGLTLYGSLSGSAPLHAASAVSLKSAAAVKPTLKPLPVV